MSEKELTKVVYFITNVWIPIRVPFEFSNSAGGLWLSTHSREFFKVWKHAWNKKHK